MKKIISIVLSVTMLMGLIEWNVSTASESIDLTPPAVSVPEGFVEADEGVYTSEDLSNPLGDQSIAISAVNELALTFPKEDKDHEPVFTTIVDMEWEDNGSGLSPSTEGTVSSTFQENIHYVLSVAYNPYGMPKMVKNGDGEYVIDDETLGKDSCIAYVGVIKRAKRDYDLVTWAYDSTTNKYTEPVYLSGNYDWFSEVGVPGYKNHMAITAGDYDGDGKDTYVIYAARPDENRDVALIEFKSEPKNGIRSTEVARVPISNLNPNVEPELWDEYDGDDYDDMRRILPAVDLTSGDFDGDGKEEIASSVGFIDIHKYSDFENRETYLAVVGKNGDSDFVTMETPIAMKRNDDDTVQRTRFNGIDSGDIDGDGLAEVITVGWLQDLKTKNLDDDDIDDTFYGVYILEYSVTSNDYINSGLIYSTDKQYLEEDESPQNAKTIIANNYTAAWRDNISNRRDNASPVVVTCVASNGIGQKEQIFVDGTIWDYNTSGTFSHSYTPDRFIEGRPGMTNDTYRWVTDAVAATFYDSSSLSDQGNPYQPAGVEQIVYGVMHKFLWSDHYWAYVEEIAPVFTANNTGDLQRSSWKINNSYNYLGDGDGLMEYRHEDSDKNLYLSLAAVDTGSDSSIAMYKYKSFTQTGVQPQAVLLAVPGYEDIPPQDGWTTYKEGVGTSTASSSGYGGGGGIAISGDMSFLIGEFSKTLGVEGGSSKVDTEESSTVSSLGFSNFSEEHMVVIYSNGLISYCYSVWNPATATWEDVVISVVSDKPSYKTIYLEDYNSQAFLDEYKLEAIDITGDMIEEIDPQDPSTYPGSMNEIKSYATGADSRLFYVSPHLSNTGEADSSSEQGISDTETEGVEKAYNVSIVSNRDLKFGFEIFELGGHVGGSLDLVADFNWGEGAAKFDTVDKLGVVFGFGSEYGEYGYDWRIASWPVEVVSNNVIEGEEPLENRIPVIGYVTENVKMPIEGPINLVASQGENSTTLEVSWDEVDEAVSYQLFRATSIDGDYQAVLADSIVDTTYSDIDLSPNTEYFYKVRALVDTEYTKYSNIASATTKGETLVLTYSSDPADGGTINVSDAEDITVKHNSGENIVEGSSLRVSIKATSGYKYTGATITKKTESGDKISLVEESDFNIKMTDDSDIIAHFSPIEYLAPNITTTILEDGNTHINYAQQIMATKDPRSKLVYSIDAGGLPNGLEIDSATGVISGTPIKSGSFKFTVAVRDQHQGYDSVDLTITINSLNIINHSIEDVDDIPVTYNTAIESIELPKTLSATALPNHSVTLPVRWNLSTYDRTVAGPYNVTGELVGDLRDPVTTDLDIIVNKGEVSSIDNVAPFSVAFGTAKDDVLDLLPEKIGVTLDGETPYTLPVSWESADYDTTHGTYTFVGIVTVDGNTVNPNSIETEAVVTVEEASISKEIVELHAPEVISVPYGTRLEEIPVPTYVLGDVEITVETLVVKKSFAFPTIWDTAAYNATNSSAEQVFDLDTINYGEFTSTAVVTDDIKLRIKVEDRVAVYADPIADREVKYGEDSLILPTNTTVYYEDGGSEDKDITWDMSEFNSKISGLQVINGVVEGMDISANVNVQKAVFTATDYDVSDVKLTLGVAKSEVSLPEDTQVTFDGDTSDTLNDTLPITWYSEDYNPFVPGDYTFVGVIEEGDHYINGLSAPGVLIAPVTVESRLPDEYTITFDGNGADTAPNPATATTKYHMLNASGLPVVSRAGYEFAGWYDAVAGGNKVDEKTFFDRDTKVYAQWIKIVEVHFFPHGGTVTPNVMSTKMGTLPTLPTPVLDTYTSTGWYNRSGQVTTDTVFNKNSAVLAMWEATVYTVRFDPDGGTVSQESQKTDNHQLANLPTSTKDGYVFLGWYMGDTLVDTQTKFLEDTTVTAKWRHTPSVSEDPVDPELTPPIDPTNPIDPIDPTDTTDPTSPPTGDTSDRALWIALLAMSSVGIICLISKKRRINKRW